MRLIHPFILASSSPQRSKLLTQMGIVHTQIAPPYDEDMNTSEDALIMVERLTRGKLDSVLKANNELASNHLVLSSDTIVSVDEHRLGKPQNQDEALHFLGLLSGRSHEVYTGMALYEPRTGIHFQYSKTEICFKKLNDFELKMFIESNEWQNVAGGYRIQGLAACYIEFIHGSYTGVVGLALEKVYKLLEMAEAFQTQN